MAPGAQLLPSGDKKIVVFSYKSYAGHPGFHGFRALVSLQFSLEHSLAGVFNLQLYDTRY